MDRKAARDLAATTLQSLNAFQQVFTAPRAAFHGESPLAVILSRSLGVDEAARGLYTLPIGLVITIYVRCDIKEDGAAEVAEDQLDDLVTTSIVALHRTGFTIDSSDATPDGAPLRNIDGHFYRAERITLRLDDEYED